MIKPRIVIWNLFFVFITVCVSLLAAFQRLESTVFQENSALALQYNLTFTAIPVVFYLITLFGLTQRKTWGLKALQCSNVIVLAPSLTPLLFLAFLVFQHGTGPETGFDTMDTTPLITAAVFLALSLFFIVMIGRSRTKEAYRTWCGT